MPEGKRGGGGGREREREVEGLERGWVCAVRTAKTALHYNTAGCVAVL